MGDGAILDLIKVLDMKKDEAIERTFKMVRGFCSGGRVFRDSGCASCGRPAGGQIFQGDVSQAGAARPRGADYANGASAGRWVRGWVEGAAPPPHTPAGEAWFDRGGFLAESQEESAAGSSEVRGCPSPPSLCEGPSSFVAIMGVLQAGESAAQERLKKGRVSQYVGVAIRVNFTGRGS